MSDYSKPAGPQSARDVNAANAEFWGTKDARHPEGQRGPEEQHRGGQVVVHHDAENEEPTLGPTGKKIRTFGGWYQHTPVMHKGEQIGFVQIKRRGGRTEMTTHHPASSSGVQGQHLDWLAKVHAEHSGKK